MSRYHLICIKPKVALFKSDYLCKLAIQGGGERTKIQSQNNFDYAQILL